MKKLSKNKAETVKKTAKVFTATGYLMLLVGLIMFLVINRRRYKKLCLAYRIICFNMGYRRRLHSLFIV